MRSFSQRFMRLALRCSLRRFCQDSISLIQWASVIVGCLWQWGARGASLGLLLIAGFACAQVGPGEQVERIEGTLSMFGRTLKVERLVSRLPAEQAAVETARSWREEAGQPSLGKASHGTLGSATLELRRPPWWIVTRHHGQWVETVQWRDHGVGAAEGIRSVMSVPQPDALALPSLTRANEHAQRLRPAQRLSLVLLAHSRTHDQVTTQVYRSDSPPGILVRRWLDALAAEGYASDTAYPLNKASAGTPVSGVAPGTGSVRSSDGPGGYCAAGLGPGASGCRGLHRSRREEILWTIAPEGDGSALVVHQVSRSTTWRWG